MKPSDLQLLQMKLEKLHRERNQEDSSDEGSGSKRLNYPRPPETANILDSRQSLRISDFNISTTLGNFSHCAWFDLSPSPDRDGYLWQSQNREIKG